MAYIALLEATLREIVWKAGKCIFFVAKFNFSSGDIILAAGDNNSDMNVDEFYFYYSSYWAVLASATALTHFTRR